MAALHGMVRKDGLGKPDASTPYLLISSVLVVLLTASLFANRFHTSRDIFIKTTFSRRLPSTAFLLSNSPSAGVWALRLHAKALTLVAQEHALYRGIEPLRYHISLVCVYFVPLFAAFSSRPVGVLNHNRLLALTRHSFLSAIHVKRRRRRRQQNVAIPR